MQLLCERCGALFHGERPAFWVAKQGADHTWTATACPTCRPDVDAEEAAFKERTKLTYNPRGRRRAKAKTIDVELPEEGAGFFPKEEDDDGIPFKIPPGGGEKDRYWE